MQHGHVDATPAYRLLEHLQIRNRSFREGKDRERYEPASVVDGKALAYIHKQWDRLTRFLRDPVMELTNNDVERGLRTWVLDRKTWMFCGHEQSARRAADALTIIMTCKNLGIDPRRYIRDTLRRILDGDKNLDVLLPENYRPSTTDNAPDETRAQLAA